MNPLDVEIDNPGFSWLINTIRQGRSQKVFRIFLGPDSSEVTGGKVSILESGIVRSSRIPAF